MSTLLINITLAGPILSVWGLVYTSNGIFIPGQSEISTDKPARKYKFGTLLPIHKARGPAYICFHTEPLKYYIMTNKKKNIVCFQGEQGLRCKISAERTHYQ